MINEIGRKSCSFWSTNTKYLKDGVHKRENHRIDCQKERVRFQLEKLWNFTIFDKKNIVKLKLCLRNQIFQFKNVYKFLTHKTISPCWNIIGLWSRFSRQIKTVNYVSEIRIEKKTLKGKVFKSRNSLTLMCYYWIDVQACLSFSTRISSNCQLCVRISKHGNGKFFNSRNSDTYK